MVASSACSSRRADGAEDPLKAEAVLEDDVLGVLLTMADECLVDERDESHAAATGTQSSTTAPTAGQPRGNLTAAPSVPPGGLTDRVRIASYTGPPAAAVPAELAGVASRSSGPSPRPRDNTSPSTNHQLPLACPGAAVYFLLQLHETGKQNHGADDSLGDGAAVAPGPRARSSRRR